MVKKALEEKLKVEIKKITRILLEAQASYRILMMLGQAQFNNRDFYGDGVLFFKYTQKNCWQKTVIELSKLFSYSSTGAPNKNRDRYNLQYFISKFKNGGEFQFVNILATKIDEWNKKLNDEQTAIKNLLEQRDKVYAHTDSNSELTQNQVSIGKINELLEIVYSILDEIYSTVFGEGILSRTVIGEPAQSLYWIMNRLNILRNMEKDALRAIAEQYGLEGELGE